MTDLVIIPDEQRARPLVPAGPPTGSTNGISTLDLAGNRRDILVAPIDAETEVEIRPDGLLYMAIGAVRRRLDDALGPGRWGIRPESPPQYDHETRECIYDGSLWVDGKFVSRAIGGCRWSPSNRRMTKSDALEGAKSNCLVRCAKDLGIGRELRNRKWREEWVAAYAEPYQIEEHRDGRTKKVIRWRQVGASLSSDELASATSILGEFPLGFGPDTPIPDGEHVGEPLKDMTDDFLREIAQKSKTTEWKLAAKAEIVRRSRKTVEAEAPAGPSVDEVLSDVNETSEQVDSFGKQEGT